MGTSCKSDVTIRSMFLNYVHKWHPKERVFKISKTIVVQANFDLRNSIFPFLNRVMYDLRKIYVLNLKTCLPKIMSYVLR